MGSHRPQEQNAQRHPWCNCIPGDWPHYPGANHWKRLEEGGLVVKKSKCEFMIPLVQYLGHCIDAKGLHPLREKVRRGKSMRSYIDYITASSCLTCQLSSPSPSVSLAKERCEMDLARRKRRKKPSKPPRNCWHPQTHFDPCLKIVLACVMLHPRIHIDFAGPISGGEMILIIIDAHLNGLITTDSSTSALVIEQLRTVFARLGLPEMIVSDNGSCFVSKEFS